MILATYQPEKPDVSLRLKDPELENILGYYPIWCFAANNLKEFLINSILAAPNLPEVLYIFETDDYKAVDAVQWNTYGYYRCHKELGSYDISKCFEICDEKYSEYVVEEIPEDKIILQINLREAIFDTDYVCDSKDPYAATLKEIVNMKASLAANFVQSSCQRINITGNGDKQKALQMVKRRTEKQAFEVYLAPFVVGLATPGCFIEDALAFDSERYLQKLYEISVLLTENYNREELPSYERQDKILNLISSCYLPFAPWGKRKIGRNDPCPCGSGKKYKKCCLGKYRV